MNKRTAEQLNQAILGFMAEIDGLLPAAKEEMPSAQFTSFSRSIGRVLVRIQDELMYPLYAEHPALKPDHFRMPQNPDRLRWDRRS